MLNLRKSARADVHASDVIRTSAFEFESIRFQSGEIIRDVASETHLDEVQSAGTGEA